MDKKFEVLADEMEGEVAVRVELTFEFGDPDPFMCIRQGRDSVEFPSNLWKRFVAEVDAELAPEWRS